MIEKRLENLEHYLNESLGGSVKLKAVSEIGLLKDQGMKDFGYGKSLEVTYEKDGQEAFLSCLALSGACVSRGPPLSDTPAQIPPSRSSPESGQRSGRPSPARRARQTPAWEAF